MKTKKGSPSGVGCRMYATAKSKPNSLTRLGFSQSVLRLLMVLLVLPMALVNAWGFASSYVKTETAATAEGLVYCNKSNSVTPSLSDYKRYYPGGSGTGSNNTSCYIDLGAAKSGVYIYCWAKPARGYEFDHWDGYEKGYLPYGDQNKTKLLDIDSWNGVNDQMVGTCGNGASTYKQHQAYFKPVTPFTITYAPPVGGSYNVHYSYLKTREKTGGEYEFYTATEEYDMTAGLEENQVVTSYAADEITLTTPTTATNFIGWYEGSTFLSMGTGANHSYTYTAHATGVTISAQFKEIGWGDVSGNLTVNVGTGTEAELSTYDGKKVYVACPTLIGTWTESDFTITTTALSNTYGSIALGSVSLDKTNNRLEIPYSYTATHWGGIGVDVTVTPAYGEAKQFTIACSAEEVVSYEACIEESGVRTYTGTLAAMMTQANSMDSKPTLKLMNPVTITSPLSFTQSFTFDVNGKVLTANCASAFSIDAAGVDVKIIDGSFTQVGEIHTSHSSSGNVDVVTFTKAAKLTMQGGTLSAENTGTGSAYGVDVQQGSIFYMTGGDLTVTAASGNAQGAHVTAASDYATFNGGSIAVSAPTNAYGMWSAGQSNITNATITVEATTGANAYGVYVNGGTSTVTTTDFTVSAKTTNAYGANVNAGRLNFNSGKLSVEAETSDVYGVHIADGATANIQQNAIVKAEATGVSGTNVVGINNLGTVSLLNVSVTATSPTTAATALNSSTSAVSTTIDGGTYRATAIGGTAYGLHHQYGALTVDGGTFRAVGSGDNIYGGRVVANGSISNATLHGETQESGKIAYGFVGGAGVTVSLTNCALEGISNTKKAYAIVTRSNLTATNCTLTANTKGAEEVYGVFVRAGSAYLNNCVAAVTSHTTMAYGVNHEDGDLTIEGGEYDVEVKQATASKEEDSKAYGIYGAAGKSTIVTNAVFDVKSSNASYSQNVYGAYINGILNSTGASYNVTARRYVYGLQGMSSSRLTLANNTIRVEATNTSTASSNSSWSYGIYANKNFTINGDKVDAIGYIKDVYAMFFGSSSDGDVLNGKFSAQGNGTNGYGALNAAGTVNKVRLKGGIYKSAINLAKYAYTDYEVYNMDGSHPDYADGYRYTIATENPSPYVCRIVGGAYYATLKEALQYTLDNSGNYTIVMTQPHTLPAGEYTLPANATLVIPYKFDQNAITVQGSNPANPDTRITAGLVENFLCLTIADGVHLNVNGKIGVGGELFCQESNKSSYINGPYGRIHMEAGSLIQLNSGSYLYAWGKITGDGNITVKNNAEVHEMFQVGDMKSASNLANYYNNNSEKFFPITQYSIQNIEVPTTYYWNSRLIGALLCYYPGLGGVYYGEKNVNLVSTESALFEITTENEFTWVRKSYKNARQVWDINSSAKLGSISINISVAGMSSSFNSANYILPITYNMDMHVLSGDFEITNNAELLPGSTIEIDKTASLTVKEGKNLYVFDKDQWPLSTSYADAAINVHGNINVEGALFTSNKGSETSKTDGANIYSTNADAGTISFVEAAPSEAATIELITSIANSAKVKKTVTMDPAQLKNGTGASEAYTQTINTEEGHAFAYINNEWQETYTNGCFEVRGSTVYAKPSGYVALKKTKEEGGLLEGVEEENHTYLTADDKILILALDCQWWEVTQVGESDVYYCATNGIYYQYQYDSEFDSWYWREKVVNVTFYSAETGTDVLKVITTNYGGIPDQAVIASNPTKATTDGYTYQFSGWMSSVDPYTTYPWTATLEEAREDMSYRPVFTATPRNYTVTFKNANNGVDVPVETAYNTHPVCTPAPAKAATAQYTYYFQYWLASDQTTQYAIDAELPAVTGATYYTAVWAQTVNKYSVIWKNGDEILRTDTKQLYGAAVSYGSDPEPTKEKDANFEYQFDGWSLTDGGDKLVSLPSVSGEMTFYAHYSTTPRYAITFANYDGTQLQKEPVTAGEHPTYNGLTPGRARDLDGYFRFIGWKNSEGTDYAPNATLPAVTGKETYTAQYDYVTELVQITFHNVTGKNDLSDEYDNWSGRFGVESTPYYDPNNDDVADKPTKEDGIEEGLMYVYTFSGWSPELELVSKDGQKEYTAQFSKEVKKYNITFTNLDGYNGASQTLQVEYGTTPEVLATLVTPEKADNNYTYAFDHWTPALETVTEDAAYEASFQAGTPRTFPITFDPDNGVDDLYVLDVAYGDTPTPTTPTKEADVANTYAFSGWSPALTAVDGPAEYTAQYTPTIRKYTIQFVNYDESVVKSTEVAYNTMPTAPSENPTKPVDTELMKFYTFTGWSPTIAIVNGDATYTAQYSEANVVATVTTAGDETSYHSSWASAIEAANTDEDGGCTLKLYANVTPSNNTTINKNMTIDLNGHTLSLTNATSTSDPQLLKVNNVALTINDSQGNGQIYYKNTAAPSQSSNTDLYCRTIYVTGASGSVTINGGTIKAGATGRKSSGSWWSGYTYYYANAVAVYVNGNSATAPHATINGGELIATETYGSNNGSGYAVYFDNASYGHVEITGGKFQGKTDIFYNGGADRVTASAATETCYFSKDPGSIAVVDNYEKRTPAGISGYTHKVVRVYTVTFQNRGGDILQNTPKYEAGETPTYGEAAPTYYTEEGNKLYTFRAWKAEGNENEYTTSFPAVTDHDITYVAQYDEVEQFEVSDNTQIEKDVEVTTTTVTVDGTLEVTLGNTLTTTNLILEASEIGSGQILDGGTITATNVYYDLTLNTDARHWHAFGVPWAVNLTTNPLVEIDNEGNVVRTLNISRDYEIMYYDGAERAAHGPSAACWKYLRHYQEAGQPVEELVPGHGYMIAFGSHVNTVRFVKKADAPIIFDGSVTVQAEGSGADRGINAIANPMAYHANLNVAGVGQVHDGGEIGSDGYEAVTISNMNYIVGKTVYVQVDNEQTITPTNGISHAAAPARRAEKATDKKYMVLEDYYTVELTDANGVGSKLYVLPEEDKEDKYVIGHDLVKMGMSTKKAQIWVKRYDVNLGLNTTAPINEVASFPIYLYAPTAGEYTISLASQPDDEYTVYLTLNGEAIWNLSETPYVLSLNAGTQKNYGLRLTANHHSPAVTTGIDEAVVDAQGETRKVIIEDKVYIIRGNNVYSVDGQLVR